MYKHKHISTDLIHRGGSDFRIVDERGRTCGVVYWITKIEARPVQEGDHCYFTAPFDATTYYKVTVEAARNGAPYGASQRGLFVPTLDEAHLEIARRTDAAGKRYAKKYGLDPE